jgi:hypothetical protein
MAWIKIKHIFFVRQYINMSEGITSKDKFNGRKGRRGRRGYRRYRPWRRYYGNYLYPYYWWYPYNYYNGGYSTNVAVQAAKDVAKETKDEVAKRIHAQQLEIAAQQKQLQQIQQQKNKDNKIVTTGLIIAGITAGTIAMYSLFDKND